MTVVLAGTVLAQDRRRYSESYIQVVKQIETMRRSKPPSFSVGPPDKAKLLHPAELPLKGYGYRLDSPDRKTNFGTDEMVYGLMILGAEMADRLGEDGGFAVQDISGVDGGKLSPHIHHQGGRDVDIGFFICDEKGQPQGNRLQAFGKDGKAKSGNLRFDLARNWLYVCLMIDSPYLGENIKFILVAEWIKDLLVNHAEEQLKKVRHPGEYDYLKKHIQTAKRVLHVKNDHDDHFHLSLKCTREDMKEG